MKLKITYSSVLWFINDKVPINFQLKLSTFWLIICILRVNFVMKVVFLWPS